MANLADMMAITTCEHSLNGGPLNLTLLHVDAKQRQSFLKLLVLYF
jgi:hypothetical protein